MPAIKPWHAASSYPEVPLICPARNSPGIVFTSQRMVQFPRIDGIVFDRVSGPDHLRIFQARNGGKHCLLHVDRHARGHAIDVHFVGVQPFRLQKNLVPRLLSGNFTILSSIEGQ